MREKFLSEIFKAATGCPRLSRIVPVISVIPIDIRGANAWDSAITEIPIVEATSVAASTMINFLIE